MIGQTISQYRITEKLGEGGMGVVYKAEDTKLNRTVALKFLPHHLTANVTEQARFLQEAQSAATLNHPNVCTIYDIKDEAGQQFIVMEYVDGSTLRAVVPVQNSDEALSYAIQIGEALHEAHSKGIVHRDIKAENIMVNSKRQIKVMDFGLAKLKGSIKLTRTSSTVGTLAYMPPEQLQGGEVDARSDIFSFGVLLFEMFTGRLPFKGEHEAALMYSIVNEAPDSLLARRPDAPAELERIINRALEKDPEDRYQHVDDVVSELRKIKKQSARVSRPVISGATRIEPPAPAAYPIPAAERVSQTVQASAAAVSEPVRESRIPLIAGAAAGFLALCIAAYFLFFPPTKSIDTLAVLPFVNAAGDPNTDYLSDGITESLINGLSQLSKLTVMSRSSVFRYKGKDVDPQKAGQELGVKAILTGRVTQRGENLLISAELVNVSNNSHIWGDQYNRKFTDIMAVQEDIAKEISRNLSVKLGGEEEKKLEKRYTENTEAYQSYLKGRYHWNKRRAEDLEHAMEYFRQAIEQDPGYALAYAGLASTYAIYAEYSGRPSSDYSPKAVEAAKKALEIDGTLAEPHTVLGLVKREEEFDWDGAESEFKKAIELNPNYPTAHHWYKISLEAQGRFQEAMAEINKALALDPLSLVINENVGDLYYNMRQYDKAIDQYKKTIDLDPNFPGAHAGLSVTYVELEKYDDALAEAERTETLSGIRPQTESVIGMIYARSGKKKEALDALTRITESANRGYSVSIDAAAVHAALGNNDEAFRLLSKACDERNSRLGGLKVAPFWEPIRSDPRYHALLKRIGLEK